MYTCRWATGGGSGVEWSLAGVESGRPQMMARVSKEVRTNEECGAGID